MAKVGDHKAGICASTLTRARVPTNRLIHAEERDDAAWSVVML